MPVINGNTKRIQTLIIPHYLSLSWYQSRKVFSGLSNTIFFLLSSFTIYLPFSMADSKPNKNTENQPLTMAQMEQVFCLFNK